MATAPLEYENPSLLAEVSWEAGEITLRVYREDDGRTIVSADSSNSLFDDIIDTCGLGPWASLIRMEHDLMHDCGCPTCMQVEGIKRSYER